MKLPISIVALTLVALCCAQVPGTETLTGHSFGSNCTSEPCDDKSEHLEAYVVQDPSPQNYITTNFGVRISNDNFTLKAGERGPDLLEDFHFREKMMHFDHERIPERVVHARGAAAHGYFQVYEPLANYTRAAFLNDPSVQTPVFVRFSTVAGFRGSADTARDVRGFAVKFYTSQGNFDLVGNNIPVFFIQDAIKFPDIIHAAKPEPHNEIPQAQTAHDNFWDFCSLSTETAHMLMWVLSDRAIPRSYRMMEGFGVNTYALVNEQGNRTFVKFHWLPALGVHSLVWDEAQKLGGVDPDFHRRDLWEAIDKGDFPEWELAMQLVPEGTEDQFEDFDILDATKIIPVERAPLIRVGRLVLTRNPDNFFAETEQVAYCTSHLVPGIEPSNDPLLQGRMFSYFDTQLTRLGGPNFEEIPINQPVVPVTNNQRDGFHRQRIDRGTVNYFPNRYGTPAEAPPSKGGYQEAKRPVSGFTVRAVGPKFAEHFNQARLFFNSLSDWEKLHLIQAAQFELGHVIDQGVRDKMIDVFNHIDFDLAVSVAQKIGVQPPTEYKGPTFNTTSGNLSQNDTIKTTIATRKIAFLVGPGYDSAQLKTISAALTTAGAMPIIIGPNLGVQNGTGDIANFTYYTTKSIQYDGLVLVGGSQYPYLKGIGEAVAFVLETFKHYKGIVAVGEGVEFLQELNLSSSPVDLTTAEGVVTESSVPSGDDLMKELVAAFGFRHFERDVTPVPAC